MNLCLKSFFFLLLSWQAVASVHQWKTHKFELNVPGSWQTMNDFFGIPYTFLGPGKNREVRATVQVIPTVAKPISFTAQSLKSFNDNYKKERMAWLKKRQGTLLKLEDARISKLGGKDVIVASLQYNWEYRAFSERTFYVNCAHNLYHLKILTDGKYTEDLAAAEKVVETFKCVP